MSVCFLTLCNISKNNCKMHPKKQSKKFATVVIEEVKIKEHKVCQEAQNSIVMLFGNGLGVN
jgi:hypothetical protein